MHSSLQSVLSVPVHCVTVVGPHASLHFCSYVPPSPSMFPQAKNASAKAAAAQMLARNPLTSLRMCATQYSIPSSLSHSASTFSDGR